MSFKDYVNEGNAVNINANLRKELTQIKKICDQKIKESDKKMQVISDDFQNGLKNAKEASELLKAIFN